MALRSLSVLLPIAGIVFGLVIACTHEATKLVDDPAGDDDDDDASSLPPTDSGLGLLSFKPSDIYSGFDGTHTFKVPFAIYDYGDDVTVTASPAGSVTLAEATLAKPVGPNGTDTGKYYIATVKAAGDITLTAKSKSKTASGTLHVTEYDPNTWTTGEGRYKAGPNTDNPPCTDCHVNGQAIDHSPAALATVTDQEVGLIVTTGISTGGFPIKINGKAGHRWEVTDEQKVGLITYLRALEPKGFK